MSGPPRYALYYAPEADNDLAAFAEQWLAPATRKPPAWGLDETLWRQATQSAAQYGFHGTLKAPFRLASGQSEQALRAAMAAFAAQRPAFAAPPLRLERFGRYLALTFATPCPEMDALHQACVTEFEPFRAPLNAQEMEKRLAAGLSPRRRQLLEHYGYPDIFDQFTFHLTLAGPVDASALETVLPVLARETAGLPSTGMKVGDICLFKQANRQSRFDILDRFALGGMPE